MSRFVVRCGLNRTLHAMNSRSDHRRGDIVIARTNRGLERGEVLCEITDTNAQHSESLPSGSIQRPASDEDIAVLARLEELQKADYEECLVLIKRGLLGSSILVSGRVSLWD
ncbi:MAG: hypothetical protein WCI02_11925 [Planctomycetota bacterium]